MVLEPSITQGIQNLANDMRLVEGKTTYVRVYPAVDVADRRVRARLRAFRDGMPLLEAGSPFLRSLNSQVTVKQNPTVPGIPLLLEQRAALNETFNFWVPPSWISGKVTFEAEINFDVAVSETDPNNNTFRSKTIEFVPKAPVCVVMIPVRTHGSRYTVDSPGFDTIIDRFKSLWPISDVWVYSQSKAVEELEFRIGIPPWKYGPYEMTEEPAIGLSDSDRVIASLWLRDTFSDDPDKCDAAHARTHYVGMVSGDTTVRRWGLGYYFIDVSWVQMTNDQGAVPTFATPSGGRQMAHELAHNYNDIPCPACYAGIPFVPPEYRWGHIECGNPRPDGINRSYPYPPAQIGPVDPFGSAFWGFDPISNDIIAPDATADYMSYCHPPWVSDYNWRGMLGNIKNASAAGVPASAAANSRGVDLDQSAEILLVGVALATLPTGNVAFLQEAYRLPRSAISAAKLEKLQSTLRPDGPLGLELVDARWGGAFVPALRYRRVVRARHQAAVFFRGSI